MAETGVTAFGRTTPALLQTGQVTTEGETEPVLEEEELFMALTQEERDVWRQMMEQQETTLKNSKEKFSTWYDGITRRRMFAYSRIRKLQEGFRKRINFYGEIADLVAAMDAKLKTVDKVKVEQKGNIVNGESTANDTPSQNHEQTPEQNQEQKPQQQQQQPQRQQQEQRQVSQETVVREQTVTVKPLLTQTS